MKKIISFFRDGKAEELIGQAAIILVLVPIIANIFTRALFSKYYLSLEAIALSAYVWLGYAGFGYLYKHELHVDVPLLRKMMPPVGREIMDWFRDVFIFTLCIVLCYYGFVLSKNNFPRKVAGCDISMGWATVSIIVGYGSGLIRSGCSILNRIIRIFQKNKEVNE